jgi:hypothetical protein
MTTSLERRYRRLLRAYPATYRRRRGDELLATLLEAAAPGQRYPTLRETLGLLGGGLSARAGVAGGCTRWSLWAEGLRLGALLLLVSLTSDAASATWLQTNHVVFTWIFSDAAGLAVTLASAAAVAAVARGWFRAALVLVGVAVAAGWSGLRYPPELWAYLTTAGILAVLAGRPPANPHRRAWPWLLATPLTLVVGLYGVHFPTDRFHPLSGVILDVRTLLPVAVLLVAVLLWLPLDPRPAIAAAVYLGPLLPGYLVTTVQYPSMGMAWWEVGPPLVIVTVTGALLVASAARAHHLSRL